jgi:hypothetical protein
MRREAWEWPPPLGERCVVLHTYVMGLRSRTEKIQMHRPTANWSKPERLTVEVVLLLLCWAVSGPGLALLGWFEWWSTALVAGLLWLGLRRMLPRAAGRFDSWWRAALVLAVASAVFNSAFPAEHVLTGRDSGTYLATAGWLAHNGTLTVDVGSDPMGGQEDLSFTAPGFYDIRSDRVLEPQFMHAYSAMLGTLMDIGGLEAAFLLNPVVGAVCLLALFGLARRFVRPAWALLAMLVLGVSLVFVYYSRAPFTELLMASFVLTGILLMGSAEDEIDSRMALLAGAMFGAATLVRLDGIVLLPLVTGSLLVRGTLIPEWADVARRARQAMFAVAVIGLGEVLLIAPPYVLDRKRNVLPILIALLVILLSHRLLQHRLTATADWVRANRRSILTVCVTTLLIVVTYAWLIRPMVTESTGNPYGLESLQESEGLQVDPNRSYAELSLQWVSWYYGAAFVVLAALGCVAVMVDIANNRGTKGKGWLPLLILVGFSALYFWRPSVNPDHIWVMRRFLTVVLPIGSLVAAVAVDRAVSVWSRRLASRGGDWLVGGALSLGLLIPAISTTAPVWNVSEFSGLAAAFTRACDRLGPDAHILFLDDESGALGHRLAQSFRSYCGLPAAWGGGELTDVDLDELAAEVTESGGRLVTIAGSGEGEYVLFEDPFEVLELTLTSVPNDTGFVDLSVSWSVAQD